MKQPLGYNRVYVCVICISSFESHFLLIEQSANLRAHELIAKSEPENEIKSNWIGSRCVLWSVAVFCLCFNQIMKFSLFGNEHNESEMEPETHSIRQIVRWKREFAAAKWNEIELKPKIVGKKKNSKTRKTKSNWMPHLRYHW